jgi:hypothetical protein
VTLFVLLSSLTASAEEGPEIVSFGRPAVVAEGQVVEEAVSFGDDVDVAGHVRGDAVSFGGNVILRSTGRIDGDAVSFGGDVQVDPAAAIDGDRVAMGMPAFGTPTPPEGPTAAGSLFESTDAWSLLAALQRRLFALCVLGGTSVLVVALFPNRVDRVARALEERPVRAAAVGSLATGFLTVFGLLFAIVTLGLGLPITFLLYTMLGVAWLLGFVAVCQAIGDRLPIEQRPQGRWIVLLVAVALLASLGSLPWLGWLLLGGVSVLGIGASITSRFGAEARA